MEKITSKRKEVIKIKISDDVIKRVKEIDLLTYLEMFEPDEIVHLSGNVYCTKTHDSLKISNGMWMWWSRGIGGKTALDYLIKVKDMEFIDAVTLLASYNNINVCIENTQAGDLRNIENKEEFFRLPERADNNDKVIKYLSGRGISKNIIEYCISEGYIYQSKEKDNVVFVGVDENREARYASLRGTEDVRFFKDVRGSDKRFSFRFVNKSSDELHIFESAIDLLSYATILEQQGSDWKNQNLVSMSGVYAMKNEEHLPLSLESLLEKNTYIKNIYLHLDNDIAGVNATKELMKMLSRDFSVHYNYVPFGKDVNDYLIYMNEKFNKIKKERDACR